MIFKKYFYILLFIPFVSYSNTLEIKSSTPLKNDILGFSLGEKSQALGNKSIAIGDNSQAKNNNAIAIGYNALATEENTVSFGNKEEKRTSRLINISEGKENTDAINLIQAKLLIDKNKKLVDNTINQFKRKTSQDLSAIETQIINIERYYKDRNLIITDAIEDLDKKMIALEKKVFAGIASTVALSNIPYLADKKFSSGMGISNYRTGTAIAGGIQYRANDNIAFRLNSSLNSEKEIIIGGGLALGW